MTPAPAPASALVVRALATALAVYGAAALSGALAFGDGALLLIWLPPSVATVAILAGGRRLALPAAIGMAAWAAPAGPAATAWAVGACTVAPLAAAAAIDAWERLKPTDSQFATTVRLLVVGACVLAPVAAAFDLRSGLLAPGPDRIGLGWGEAFAVEAMSAAVAVRSLMTLLPDRAGGYCPIELARSGRVGLSKLEWGAWAALGVALGAGALAASLGASGAARLVLIAGFSVAVLGAMIGGRRNTCTMLLVATLLTMWLRARVEPFSLDPGYLTNIAQFVLLVWLGGAISHLLNASSSERIAHENRLRELAMTDVDSGLPNARAFQARLDACRAAGAPAGGQLVEVRVPEIDRWAELAGRAAANAFERSAGLALGTAFGAGFVAHVGPGRYALLVPGRTDDARILAGVRGAIDLQRVEAGGERAGLRSVVGVVDVGADGFGDAESLLAAMSIARQRAQLEPERYLRLELSASLVEAHRNELRAMRTVREALHEGRLRLLGQPIVRADGARDRLHFEVLTRLLDDEGREISPATFLPALARMGLLQTFDRLVVARALERLGRDEALSACTATCAINLTGPTFADPSFPSFLFERLAATGVRPGTVKLEITESDPITSLETAMRNNDALVRGGLGFALDDFGTGLATFDYLRRFAPDWVKIDGSFVRAVDDGVLERQIVDSIVRVAQAAGAATVAECVETPAAAARMRELGIDYLQGWGVARPMPLETLVAFHRHGAASPHGEAAASRVEG